MFWKKGVVLTGMGAFMLSLFLGKPETDHAQAAGKKAAVSSEAANKKTNNKVTDRSDPQKLIKKKAIKYSKKTDKIVVSNLDGKKLELAKGEGFQFETQDSKLSKGSVIRWRSSNKKIASVNKDGEVKTKKTGKIKITGYVDYAKERFFKKGKKRNDQVKYSLVVRKFIKVKSIKITTEQKDVFVGDDLELSASVTPEDTDEDVVWSSSDESIASVEDGTVTAETPGTVTITCKSEKSKKKSKKVIHIRENIITKLRFPKSKIVVGVGNTIHPGVIVSPKYVTDRKMIYQSSNPAVASVNADGTITGRKTGVVTVTATWEKDKKMFASCEVTVSEVKGQLTRAMLDKMNLKTAKNLMVVAHPDDEVIWGGAHLASDDYLVVVLTNAKTENGIRAKHFNDAMDISGDARIILSYTDDKKDPGYRWQYSQLAIKNDLNLLLSYKKWNTIVTHNPDGEYGHIHHKRTSAYVTELYKNKPSVGNKLMYFGKYYKPAELKDSSVLSTLVRIDSKLYEKKTEMINAYSERINTMYNWLGHMQPYENWIAYQDWK